MTYWTTTTTIQIANVPLFPNELKKIVAMGCPMGLETIPSISVPMQNASATLIPATCT